MLTSVGSTTPSTTDGCGGSSSIASRTSGSCGSSRNGWTRELSRTASGRPARREPRRGRRFPPCSRTSTSTMSSIFGARQWRRRQAHGDVVIVRFADDLVVGFQQRADAERFYADLVQRFARFGLELNAEKTRLIEFGRFAVENRRRRGLGRPETFSFLGFTHMCAKTRAGRFALRRKTIAKRMAAKLREVKALIMRRRHWSIAEQGHWLGSVVRGHIAYYAVPGNIHAVSAFRKQVTRHWGRALRRRSQRHRLTWDRMGRLEARWLPPARITHPWPNVRFDARTQGRTKVGAQCTSSARWDLSGGPPARAVPTGNDPEVGEQQGDRLGRHRAAPVGVQGQLVAADVLLGAGLADQRLGQRRGLPGGDHPADDVAGVDVQDHVQVEVGPLGRAVQFGVGVGPGRGTGISPGPF